MRHPNMKAESPVPATPGADQLLSRSAATSAADGASTVALLTRVQARAAANDDAAETPGAVRNPLWLILIGMACFFGVAAVLMALG
jgi:hypothetical protein